MFGGGSFRSFSPDLNPFPERDGQIFVFVSRPLEHANKIPAVFAQLTLQ